MVTACLGLAGVILVAFLPFMSDVFRIWMRQNGMSVGSPFGPGEFEYPPLGSLYMERLTGLPTPGIAVMTNGLLMVVAATAITLLLVKNSTGDERPAVYLWAASPGLVFLLPLNFDVAAALMTLLAVMAIGSQRLALGGVSIGVGAMLKVFPGSLILPVLPLIAGWKRRSWFLASGAVVVFISYLIFWLALPETWLLHFEFAEIRTDSWTTIWRFLEPGLSAIGIDVSNRIVNSASILLTLVSLLGVAVWAKRRNPSAGTVAVIAVIAFLFFNKVFKPQYVLWVTPLYAYVGGRIIWARLLEYSAIVELATYYVPLPGVVGLLTLIGRTIALLAMAIHVGRSQFRVRNPPFDTAVKARAT